MSINVPTAILLASLIFSAFWLAGNRYDFELIKGSGAVAIYDKLLGEARICWKEVCSRIPDEDWKEKLENRPSLDEIFKDSTKAGNSE